MNKIIFANNICERDSAILISKRSNGISSVISVHQPHFIAMNGEILRPTCHPTTPDKKYYLPLINHSSFLHEEEKFIPEYGRRKLTLYI